MQTRRFGRTELHPTILSFGAMRIPPIADESAEQNEQRAFATLRRALDVGINHIETARGYGPSEELIGKAIAQGVIRRNEFILTTKVCPTQTADAFRSDLEDSLRRLNVDRLDNLDVHGINTPDLLRLSVDPRGMMMGIRQAMTEGLVSHLGFATHAPLQVILDAIATDEFESVNLHYYFINQRNRPAVELAASRDMGVYIISPTDKGGRLFAPPHRLVELCKPMTPIFANQRWLLAQPEVHTLSVGASTPDELDDHLAGVATAGPLTEQEQGVVARLEQALRGIGDTYCSFCHECLPCPEDVHIPEILRLRNLLLAYDMLDFARYRYGMFVRYDAASGERVGGAGHWFPGTQGDFCTRCGECLPRCPLDLSIPDLLAEAHEKLSGTPGRRLWK